jgi:2-C-methyl-D-erythritol 4-phosphate cytidylyltransferase/2-C-methyl-D-erythritol 2,4-cyclodiphosphate synthase
VLESSTNNAKTSPSELDGRDVAFVIVAAGRGERARDAGNGPKQYFDLGGKTVLARTLDAIAGAFSVDKQPKLQVVIHRDDDALFASALAELENANALPAIYGGETRQASVREGLRALKTDSPDIVLIHDAARPFVSRTIISDLIDTARAGDASLPLAPIFDTVKTVEGDEVSGTLDRDGLGLAQTPQAFRYPDILELHEKAAQLPCTFTDDVAIAEHFGMKVKAVGGDTANIKLTSAADFQRARTQLSRFLPDIRMGTAYDVHRSEPGTEITLCGLVIPSPVQLIGHSDADVALHALTDAVLGALADGDIGSHFPPSDEKWRGAASDQFLIHAMKRAAERGAVVTMLDVTIICEAPKIGPHRDAMRHKISAITGLSVERIAVKATTNETIGFIGRQEGIAAVASATVVFPNPL